MLRKASLAVCRIAQHRFLQNVHMSCIRLLETRTTEQLHWKTSASPGLPNLPKRSPGSCPKIRVFKAGQATPSRLWLKSFPKVRCKSCDGSFTRTYSFWQSTPQMSQKHTETISAIQSTSCSSWEHGFQDNKVDLKAIHTAQTETRRVFQQMGTGEPAEPKGLWNWVCSDEVRTRWHKIIKPFK